MAKRIFKSFAASCLALFVGSLISGATNDLLSSLFNDLDVDFYAIIAIGLIVVLNTVVFYIIFSEIE